MKTRWMLSLALVCGLATPAMADGPYGKTDVFASEAAFAHAVPTGVRYDQRLGGFRLQDNPAGGYLSSGSFVYDDLHYGFGFDRVVASWNADCPPGTMVVVELQASPDDGTTC